MSDPVDIHELPSELTVMDAVRKFADLPGLLLLDSSGPNRPGDARFSFLTADPLETLRLDRVRFGDDPFGKLRDWQSRLPDDVSSVNAPPFCGGIAGLMSYELGMAFEKLPQPTGDAFATPVLSAGLYDWAIVWDHVERTVRLCVLSVLAEKSDRANWVRERLQQADRSAVTQPAVGLPDDQVQRFRLPNYSDVYSCFSREDYTTAVERVIEYIRAGDIFQANLSQQLTTNWDHSALDLYDRLRHQNPAPFCGLYQADDFAVVSASPERFLSLRGRDVETRPIKGTRRRHRSPIADLFTGDELVASEKDRAENVMIVDLLRNDISRVCAGGSVKVTGLCEVEVFETVQHLVSTIVGQLKPNADVWDLCAATIPGGSITGAPKIRAMEIIAELEPVVRGAYCGNLFYLGPGDCFDSNILIRTFTLKNGRLQFPVGGGIVADSDPDDEYKETLHKAAGLLSVLR